LDRVLPPCSVLPGRDALGVASVVGGWRCAADTRSIRRQRLLRVPETSRSRAGLVLAVYVAIAFLWLVEAWVPSGGTSGPVGSLGDPLLFVWYLAWVPFAIGHGLNPLFTTFLMAPDGANLLINTSILLPSLVLAPVTVLFGPVVSYNVLITASLALSAWAAYLACRRITGSEVGAIVCGLLYGFGPYMQAQSLAHAHLVLALFPPFVLVMVHELAVSQRRPPRRVGALLGLGCVAQLLTGQELFATTLLMSALFLAVLVLMHREQVRARLPHLLRGLAAAAVIGVVLGGPLIAFELFGARHVNGLLQPRNTYVADVAGFVVPTRLEWLSTPGSRDLSDTFTGFSGEQGVYLGVPLLLIIGFAVWRLRSRPTARVASIMLAASAVLSLGSTLHVVGHDTRLPMPWLTLSHVPLMENAAPDRLALFTTLAAGILLALSLQDLAKQQSRARLVGWTTLVIGFFAIVPTVPAPTASLDLPRFFDSRSASLIPADTTALVYPRQSGSYLAMAAQVESDFQFRLAQGGVFTPEGFGAPASSIYEVLAATEEGRRARGSASACTPAGADVNDPCRRFIAAELRRYRIGAVIIIDVRGAGTIGRLFTAYYRRSPIHTNGVRLWVQPPPRGG
jgi:hypothetical protein